MVKKNNPKELSRRKPTLDFINLKKKKVMKINQSTIQSSKAKAPKIKVKG